MTAVSRSTYDAELAALRAEVAKMGDKVGQAIDDAVHALATQNVALAQRVMDEDDVIDAMEVAIEDHCMVLIARQQPMARDLRIIGTGLKLSTDLERIGDHAFDIAKIALKLADEPLIKPLVDIPRMGEVARKMLADALQAYRDMDVTLAEQVCLDDEVVDNIYDQIFRELLTYMMENPKTISQATQLIFAARYLERVADHATNIAEWLIYLATGQRMRKK